MQRYLGLISGTSMDAVDAALVGFEEERSTLIACRSKPLDGELRARLGAVTGATPLHAVAALDVRIGRLFAAAAMELLQQAGVEAAQVAAIGSHGQTVWHDPRNSEAPCSLQLGDPNIIAHATGIVTVADFRRMDVAAGGEGAPITPAFHLWRFGRDGPGRVVLNLGGMANLTLLPGDGGEVGGFDSGPGNVLLDEWIRACRGEAFDRDGAWAASGRPDEPLLEAMLADAYFAAPPPKSTGRELFSLPWLRGHLQQLRRPVADEDVQATLLALTVRTIATAVRRYAPAMRDVIACGGGVHNRYLMQQLAEALRDCTIVSSAEHGTDPDFIEAIAFAWFAWQRLQRRRVHLPHITGAHRRVTLGGIYAP